MKSEVRNSRSGRDSWPFESVLGLRASDHIRTCLPEGIELPLRRIECAVQACESARVSKILLSGMKMSLLSRRKDFRNFDQFKVVIDGHALEVHLGGEVNVRRGFRRVGVDD